MECEGALRRQPEVGDEASGSALIEPAGRGRRGTRQGLLGGGPAKPQVLQDLPDDLGILDAGNDLYRSTAEFAVLDVDRKDALQALCPAHRRSTSRAASRRFPFYGFL